MTWLNGRIERQLVTALLLLALLVSCGLAGRAGQPSQPADPTLVAEEPTETPPDPTAEEPAPAANQAMVPTTTPLAIPSTSVGSPSASASMVPTVTVVPSIPPTPTRVPSAGPLAKYRLVTYYGHPASDRMGILGEFDQPEQMIAKLKEQTAAYTAADPSRPGLCTIELIASVAQGSAGSDGLWLLRTPATTIERYSQLAEKHGCLLMLDVQMGYDTVANDIAALLPFLQRPHVHLAIDPEFHVARGQQPGEHFGSITAADVNAASKLLGDLVRKHNLPDKVLVIHQFRDDMLPDKKKITPLPNVDLVIMMDGWGGQEAKTQNYAYFVKEQLIQYGGIKLFYRQDVPVMTPEQILELDPKPLVVIYQ